MIPHFQEHASNERTFLSWTRTAMAVSGFGIVIERLQSSRETDWTGLALLCLGAVLMLVSTLRFALIRKQIELGDDGAHLFGRIEILFALMVSLLLLLVIVFVLSMFLP